MVSVLILSHGGLAAELLKAAETISGGVPQGISAVCLDWDDSFEEARQRTARAILELDPKDGLLILTDMYGGTPFNVASSFIDSTSVQVLAGVNLPMVLRLCCMGSTQMSPEELVAWIEEKGRRSICHSDDAVETAVDACASQDAERKPQ